MSFIRLKNFHSIPSLLRFFYFMFHFKHCIKVLHQTKVVGTHFFFFEKFYFGLPVRLLWDNTFKILWSFIFNWHYLWGMSNIFWGVWGATLNICKVLTHGFSLITLLSSLGAALDFTFAWKPFLNFSIICHLESLALRNSFIFF